MRRNIGLSSIDSDWRRQYR